MNSNFDGLDLLNQRVDKAIYVVSNLFIDLKMNLISVGENISSKEKREEIKHGEESLTLIFLDVVLLINWSNH